MILYLLETVRCLLISEMLKHEKNTPESMKCNICLWLNLYIYLGNSQVVQWSGLYISTTRHMGLIPGQGTKILHGSAKKTLQFYLFYFQFILTI